VASLVVPLWKARGERVIGGRREVLLANALLRGNQLEGRGKQVSHLDFGVSLHPEPLGNGLVALGRNGKCLLNLEGLVSGHFVDVST